MLKRYWWTYIQKKRLTDSNTLYKLIKAGNYIYFKYTKSGTILLFDKKTKIDLVGAVDFYIWKYYRKLPNWSFYGLELKFCFFNLYDDYTYKIITEQEFNKIING